LHFKFVTNVTEVAFKMLYDCIIQT
jgi:hypothetical protein